MDGVLNRMRALVSAGLLASGAVAATLVPGGHDGYLRVGDDTVLTWRNAGTVQVKRPCTGELLLVGGGGGGGSSGPESEADARNGVDGLGAGGAGDGKGGSGIVIIRYLRPEHGTVLTFR